MKFKIDENLPKEVAEVLRKAGHETSTVLDEGLGGKPDGSIARVCALEDRTLLTLDLDFADIRNYPPVGSPGFIVFRVIRDDKIAMLSVVEKLIPKLLSEDPRGHLWIVEDSRVRIRP